MDVNVSTNSIAHMLRIIKTVVSKGHVFQAPDNHSNKEVNVDVISNVMTFLTLRFKVQTVYSFKTSYFHEYFVIKAGFHRLWLICFSFNSDLICK